jgi:hypothetical protein
MHSVPVNFQEVLQFAADVDSLEAHQVHVVDT